MDIYLGHFIFVVDHHNKLFFQYMQSLKINLDFARTFYCAQYNLITGLWMSPAFGGVWRLSVGEFARRSYCLQIARRR